MTSNTVLYAARVCHDPGDEFGWVQGWRSAIADYLTHEWGESAPGFRPSPMGPHEEAYEYEELRGILAEPEELRYALRILDRYREWLCVAGRDY
ncbi:hypothetical protein Shyd_66000 [Streptomyces hydrogenans]|uniref:Uncharacterized protein n=1 Tax=Streptomyces hydrogenans TaxID=1873719 RepID=A0ABQ3PJN0_9ACTN|nr:hypothetical protein GCM10018784_23190 [Streptomyces hydrogenans]GHI25229.1 hypothetical protein Shyd_66000 [Streptomyces hydrogenans]